MFKDYKRRLEEISYHLWLAGDEERAKELFKVAINIKKPTSMLTVELFLNDVIKRSIWMLAEIKIESEKKEKNKLIISPDGLIKP